MKKTFLNKKYIITVIISSLIFSLIMLVGGFAYYDQIKLFSFLLDDLVNNFIFFISNFLIFLIVTIVISVIFYFYPILLNKSYTLKSSKLIFIVFPILICAYGFVYLLYFPGILGYDVYMQIPQALGRQEYTTHHPIAHTFLIKICLRIGELFTYDGSGVVIYSVFQIIIFCACITYIVYTVNKENRKLISVICTTLWYAFFPTFALLSFNMTKDTLFSAFFAVFSIKLFYLIKNKNSKKIDYFITGIFAVLSCMFRNNAIYVLMVIFLILLIIKAPRKSLLSVIIPIIIFFIFNNIFIGHILKINGPNQEKLSIPIYQMTSVSVMYPDLIDTVTYDQLEEYLPEHRKLYNNSTVDLVKSEFNNNKYVENKLAFWKLWFQIGLKSPVQYLKSALKLNLQSWYPYYKYNDPYYYTQYISTGFSFNYIDETSDVQRIYILPNIRYFYDNYSYYGYNFMKYGVTALLFSISFPFLYLYQIVVQCIAYNKHKVVIAFLPMILLWATYLLGPLSNIRYFLPILILVPLGVTIFFNENKRISA